MSRRPRFARALARRFPDPRRRGIMALMRRELSDEVRRPSQRVMLLQPSCGASAGSTRAIALLGVIAVMLFTACARRAVNVDDSTRGEQHALVVEGLAPIDLVAIEAHAQVAAFWIARSELTHAQYAAFVRATGYDGSAHPSSKPGESFLRGWSGAQPPYARAQHPVCNVNVHHARAWCAWAASVSGRRVRLPTDAEWELAARGPEGREYPWGMEWDATRCNFGDAAGGESFGALDGFAEAAPVGSFPRGATPAGVLDLAGNIWEWTEESSLRGGAWCLGPQMQRSAAIAREDPERADDKFGFRFVVER